MVYFCRQLTAARRIPVLPLFWQGVFLSRRENCIMMYTKKNMDTASLNAAFINGIGIVVSISDLSVFCLELL